MTTRTYRGIVHVSAVSEHRFEIDPPPITRRLAADQTGGILSLFESTFPSGIGDLALHIHWKAETFYILDGECEFTGIDPDGPYTFRARSGDVVHIPAGVPHHVFNDGLTMARGLVLRPPGGFERYLAADATSLHADRPTGDPPVGARVRERLPAVDAGHQVLQVRADVPPPAEPQRQIVHVTAGEGAIVPMGSGTNTVKLTSADTAGAMTILEGSFPPGAASVPLHTHPEAETFCLLEGEAAFTGVDEDGPSTFVVRPGDVVHVSPRTPHQFAIIGATPMRGIVIVQPGGFEQYLAELSAARRPDGSADMAVLRAIGARYGVEYVDPSGR